MLPSVQYSTVGRLEPYNSAQSLLLQHCKSILCWVADPSGLLDLFREILLWTLGIVGYGAHAFLVL